MNRNLQLWGIVSTWFFEFLPVDLIFPAVLSFGKDIPTKNVENVPPILGVENSEPYDFFEVFLFF